MDVPNKVQLITYPDSLGGDLKKLSQVLDQYFPGLFEGGVHILPPFPSDGDRGFAPLTYFEIDPRLGDWEDIQRIGEKHTILLDLIVNHISSKSQYFQDYLEKGDNSAYADLFIPIQKIWPGGIPEQSEIDKIFLRRHKPFSEYRIPETGEGKTLWTTFGKSNPSEQVDVNTDSKMARQMLQDCIENFSKNRVRIVRLDAVGYVVKKPGTSCFFVEPEIFQFMDWMKGIAGTLNIELLPEVHAEYSTQLKLAEKGYWIYDFILPYLIFETLIDKNSKKLKAYLAARPRKQFTMLDCHDGIPVLPDLNGLIDMEHARSVVNICLSRGGNVSRIFSKNFQGSHGFDVHQIRGTYFSLLDCDELSYLMARAIQFFVPGIPQVYYVGLLAGKNDEEAYQKTGDGREINRHNYSVAEIDQEVQRPVVKKLIRLIQFRNSHPAFDGDFQIDDCSDHEICLSWAKGESYARLNIDLLANTFSITDNDGSSEKVLSF